MRMKLSMLCVKKAFTLVELLVVISIIAMLLAVLMPALSKAKSNATKLICSTRLKDIGTATGLYGADYNGAVPPSYPLNQNELNLTKQTPGVDMSWCGRLAKYYNKNRTPSDKKGESIYEYSLYRCPTQDYIVKYIQMAKNTGKSVRLPLGALLSTNNAGGGVFGINPYFAGYGAINGDNTYNFRSLLKVKKTPATLPLLGDMCAETKGSSVIAGWVWSVAYPHSNAYKYGWPSSMGNSNEWGPAPNHAGKINYVFGDFHVETRGNIWPWNDFKDPRTSRASFFQPDDSR